MTRMTGILKNFPVELATADERLIVSLACAAVVLSQRLPTRRLEQDLEEQLAAWLIDKGYMLPDEERGA